MAVHVHHAMAHPGDGDDDHRKNPMEEMTELFGPGHVDSSVRHAIQACWMALPKERRNPTEVEKEIRRLVERAISNLHEDAKSFGRSE